MHEVFPPNYRDAAKAHVADLDAYRALYERSVRDNEGFWAEQAQRLDWFSPWRRVREVDYHQVQIKWFEGGTLNVAHNCLDRHVEAGHGDQTALIWEGNDPSEDKRLSYREVAELVD